MFDKDINEKIYTLLIKKMPDITSNPEIQEVLKSSFRTTLDEFNRRETNTIVAFPIRIAQARDKSLLPLGYEITVLWFLFLEYVHIFDCIQDRDFNHPLVKITGPEQGINVAVIVIHSIYRLIEKLPLAPERQRDLQLLFNRCQAETIEGQYRDLRYFNFSDEDLDPIEIAEKKSSPSSVYMIQSLFVALGENADCYNEYAVKSGALKSILSDYSDIWMKREGSDLVALAGTMPIMAALKNESSKETASLLLAGKNSSVKKQLQLKRYLSTTEAVENFETYLNEVKEKILSFHEELPYLECIVPGTERTISDCEIMISSLKKIREHAENDTYAISVVEDHISLAQKMIEEHISLEQIQTRTPLEAVYLIELLSKDEQKFVIKRLMNYTAHLLEQSKLEAIFLLGKLVQLTKVHSKELYSKIMELYTEYFNDIESIKWNEEYKKGEFYLIAVSTLNASLVDSEHDAVVTVTEQLDLLEEMIDKIIYPHTEIDLFLFKTLFDAVEEYDLSHPAIEKGREILLKQQGTDGGWYSSPLATAMASNILYKYDGFTSLNKKRAIRYLVEHQDNQGYWSKEGFPMGIRESAVITTDICLQGLLLLVE